MWPCIRFPNVPMECLHIFGRIIMLFALFKDLRYTLPIWYAMVASPLWMPLAYEMMSLPSQVAISYLLLYVSHSTMSDGMLPYSQVTMLILID